MKPFQFMTLYITRRCNLKCSYCGVYSTEIEDMSTNEWIKALDLIIPHSEFFNILGGEPTLHEGLPSIIRHLEKKQALYSLVTNSTNTKEYYKKLVEEDGISSFTISIDYYDIPNEENSSVYKTKRGQELVKFLRQIGYKGEIVFSTALREENVDEMKKIINFGRDYNCKMVFCMLQMYSQEKHLYIVLWY